MQYRIIIVRTVYFTVIKEDLAKHSFSYTAEWKCEMFPPVNDKLLGAELESVSVFSIYLQSYITHTDMLYNGSHQ